MTTIDIIILCIAGSIFLALFIAGFVRIAKQRAIRKEEMTREVESVKIKKGVRYTDDKTVVTKQGDMNVTFNRTDILLKQDITYVAEKNGFLMPGKYVVLSLSGGEQTFNIRIGKFVKEYKHNQKIVISENNKVTCVSSDVILR